jgi:hypothetical protein
MQLSSSDRRTVIEDLLDIQIFSTMNVITKQRFSATKVIWKVTELSWQQRREEGVH